jgi:uncharacterized protein YkuJ
MRVLTVLLVAIVVALSSCASSAPDVVYDAQPQTTQPAKPKAAADGQIPVEKKSLIKFADGSLDEYIESEYDPSDVMLLFQNRFTASGSLVEQVEYTYHEEKYYLTAKMTKDDENKLKNRIVYQYNDRDLLAIETIVNKAGKAVSSNEYGYNGEGHVISRSIKNGAGAKLAETVYTYNGNGLITSSETKDANGRKISASESQYDADGNLVNQKFYNSAGNVTRTVNIAWENGMEVKNEQRSASGDVQMRITNVYGETGELLKKTVENIQGGSVQVMEFEYTFRPART